ncbi:cytochrome b [Acidovorax sp. CCYZU-2555]|uniref:cytochrome b n=1 Tax=Acidovorax sp. CCYZU-2555 TaxID=2835042 RepID=UPI001BCBF4FF|nr:cytochrome b [Acidovorax sp. CCYZU-2555]MBS7776842.1 cytochrome b [Acidovorax sp. CCYZU-2555]
MTIFNTSSNYGSIAKLLHWTTAGTFIGAYIIVYYVIWFMDDTKPESLPFLNVHWALGIIAGVLIIPRMIWRMLNIRPADPAGSAWEHRLAHWAHFLLYGLLIAMPLTGYLGTGADTNFGLFSVQGFNSSSSFALISRIWGVSWQEFEVPMDVVHHFLGKWVGWSVVGLHVFAALYHHAVRHDEVLLRMLPFRKINETTKES